MCEKVLNLISNQGHEKENQTEVLLIDRQYGVLESNVLPQCPQGNGSGPPPMPTPQTHTHKGTKICGCLSPLHKNGTICI